MYVVQHLNKQVWNIDILQLNNFSLSIRFTEHAIRFPILL